MRTIKDFDKNYPICLAGKGKTSPEDVGGEPGYEQLLGVIADQSHPDHKDMVRWARSLKDFDIDSVNKILMVIDLKRDVYLCHNWD